MVQPGPAPWLMYTSPLLLWNMSALLGAQVHSPRAQRDLHTRPFGEGEECPWAGVTLVFCPLAPLVPLASWSSRLPWFPWLPWFPRFPWFPGPGPPWSPGHSTEGSLFSCADPSNTHHMSVAVGTKISWSPPPQGTLISLGMACMMSSMQAVFNASCPSMQAVLQCKLLGQFGQAAFNASCPSMMQAVFNELLIQMLRIS